MIRWTANASAAKDYCTLDVTIERVTIYPPRKTSPAPFDHPLPFKVDVPEGETNPFAEDIVPQYTQAEVEGLAQSARVIFYQANENHPGTVDESTVHATLERLVSLSTPEQQSSKPFTPRIVAQMASTTSLFPAEERAVLTAMARLGASVGYQEVNNLQVDPKNFGKFADAVNADILGASTLSLHKFGIDRHICPLEMERVLKGYTVGKVIEIGRASCRERV